MKRPWFPLYIADYLSDTAELSLVEHGAYMKLLMHCWRLDCKLPNDIKKLWRLCGASNQYEKRAVEKIVENYFLTIENQTCLTSKRLFEEYSKCLKISETNSTNVSNRYKSRSQSVAPQSQLQLQEEDVDIKTISTSRERSPIPYQKIVDLYLQILPELKTPKLDETIKKHIKARYTNGMGNIEAWESYFQRVKKSPFLTGKVNNFMANLLWLVGRENMSKVHNGLYDDRQPKSAHDTVREALEDGPDGILRIFGRDSDNRSGSTNQDQAGNPSDFLPILARFNK